MAILSFIIAASMLCVFLCGALKSIRSFSVRAGNAGYFEAFVFFFSQIAAGLFNLWLADGENGNIIELINAEGLSKNF